MSRIEPDRNFIKQEVEHNNEVPKKAHHSSTIVLFLFSIATNLLLLAMPIYLAQLYDRVLPSGNLDTLVYLSGFILTCLALHGAFETIRGRIAHNMGTYYELSSAPGVLRSVVTLRQASSIDLNKRMNDLALVRQAMASRAFIGLFDLPFSPLFLGLLFVLHPIIGGIGLVGVISLIALAVTNEYLVHNRMRKISAGQNDLDQLLHEYSAEGKNVRAMNIARPLVARWLKASLDLAQNTGKINRINTNYFGFLRFFRQMIQLCILGVGTLLVIEGNLSAGLIFAASIIGGKALMPIEQLIGSWRLLASALNAHRRMQAFERLKAQSQSHSENAVALPSVKGQITCDGVTVVSDDQTERHVLLADISFKANPGEVIALIGPSGSGKSILLEAMAGLRLPARGKIRLDGHSIEQWKPDVLGKNIGFAGQSHNFLSGTISENIARFSEFASDTATSKAAGLAGMHGLIGTIENGYRQQLDKQGNPLSAGQKQWIKLSRAFYGDPQILLLDEPDTGLDQIGEAMLRKAIARARSRGKTVIFSTQKARLAKYADMVLLLDRGRIIKQGNSTSVLKPRTGNRDMQESPEKHAS